MIKFLIRNYNIYKYIVYIKTDYYSKRALIINLKINLSSICSISNKASQI